MKLPAADVPIFSGEPIRYCNFIDAFESTIEANEKVLGRFLYYLSQNTRGLPQELVRSCLHIKNLVEALCRVKVLMKENYGQHCQIISAFVLKLGDGPVLSVNNAKELKLFVIALEVCPTISAGISCVSEVVNQYVLRQITNRLPVLLQDMFGVVCHNIMHEIKRSIFVGAVNFVRKHCMK